MVGSGTGSVGRGKTTVGKGRVGIDGCVAGGRLVAVGIGGFVAGSSAVGVTTVLGVFVGSGDGVGNAVSSRSEL